jgi:ABC-type multidrug transport system fused ATPase/permease subunit
MAKMAELRQRTDARPEKEKKRMQKQNANILEIAIGVALGITLAGVIGFVARAWLAQQALREIQRGAVEAAERMKRRQAETLRRMQTEQLKRAEAAERLKEAERQRLASEERAQEMVRKANIDAANAREAAWSRYYVKPKRCENPASNEVLVECANEHIRAKRAFEKKYADGGQ